MTRRPLAFAFAAFALLGVTLAACGDDDDGGTQVLDAGASDARTDAQLAPREGGNSPDATPPPYDAGHPGQDSGGSDSGDAGADAGFDAGPFFPPIDPTAWTAANGALILDGGVFSFPPDAICKTIGTVKQTVMLPPVSNGGMRLDIDTSVECGGGPCAYFNAAFSINGTAQWGAVGDRGLCLGEAGRGGPAEIVITGDSRANCNDPRPTTVKVTKVEIVRDLDCPAPGQITDPHFDIPIDAPVDGPVPGWAVGGQPGTTSKVENGQLHIGTTPAGCSVAQASGTMSIPSSTKGLALSMKVNGPAGGLLEVDGTEGKMFGVVTTTGALAEHHVCIPEGAKGTVSPLMFAVNHETDQCLAAAADFTVDDLAFVEDASCPGALYHDGFEGDRRFYVEYRDGTVAVGNVAANAQEGSHYLEYQLNKTCQEASVFITTTVPAPNATGGPALKLAGNVPVDGDGVSWDVQIGLKGYFQDPAPGYKDVTVCLDPLAAGRVIDFRLFGTTPKSGTCGVAHPYVMRFDNVRVENDPSCPKQ